MTRANLKGSAATLPVDKRLIAGRYRTRARIGSGRLGEIFAATDEHHDELGGEQHLAIQIIPESIVRNNKLFNKISLGYTQLRACAHPNIVEYLQFGRYGKLGFLVMEEIKKAHGIRPTGDCDDDQVPSVYHPIPRNDLPYLLMNRI